MARGRESEKMVEKYRKREGERREKSQMGIRMARVGLVWPGGREGKGGEGRTKDENGEKK